MFDNVFALEGGHPSRPGRCGFGLYGKERAGSAFAVQSGLQDNNAMIASVEFAQLVGSPGLWLDKNTPPAVLLDVLPERIRGHTVERTNLNEG